MLHHCLLAFSSSLFYISVAFAIPWNATEYMFVFGDSAPMMSETRSTGSDRLFSQVDVLFNAGARNFLFLMVPPTNRAPLFLEQGSQAAARMGTVIANYNTQPTQSVRNFQANHTDLGSVTVFDTQPIFNTLLDGWQTFGFVNVTGYRAAYENGTSTPTYQVEGCAPVSSYFWLNVALHPLFAVHDILVKAVSTALADYPATQIPT